MSEAHIIYIINRLNDVRNEHIFINDFKSKNNVQRTEKQKKLMNFFNLFDKNTLDKLNEIHSHIDLFVSKEGFWSFFYNEKRIENSWIRASEFTTLFSILLFKSIHNININSSSKDIYFTNSDQVLNNMYDYITKFSVYYFNETISDRSTFRGEVFKIIAALVEKKIIKEKICRVGNRTIKEWSVDIKTTQWLEWEGLNLSLKPYEIIEVNDEKYLKGSFFNEIFKVFTENVQSGEKFHLKDLTYLEKLRNMVVYVDNSRVKDIINIIENHENISFEQINCTIQNINTEIVSVSNNLKYENDKIRVEYKKMFQKEVKESYKNYRKKYYKVSEIITIKNFIYANIAKNFVSILNKKQKKKIVKTAILENIIIKNIEIWINEHIKNFKHKDAHIIKKFKPINIDEENISYEEEDINYEEEDINYKKDLCLNKADNLENNMNLCAEEKYNHEALQQNFKKDNISLSLNNLLLLNKKDIEVICLKQKKKILNLYKQSYTENLNVEDLNVEDLNVEDLDVEDLDKLALLASKLIKGSSAFEYCMNKRKINTYSLITQGKNLQRKLSKLYVWSNLKALNGLTIDQGKKMYLPFFFDFRGRFYYNSISGPTTLKFSRYIYFYGYYSDYEINNYVKTKASKIILEYSDIIKEIKILFNIKKNQTKIDEAVYWVLMAIGKIFIDKNKIKTHRDKIIKSGVEALKNEPEINNLLDKIEFYHYKKILNDLSLKDIPKVGVLKDSTASFIQNLIRIMGYKNENSLIYANLRDSNYWYDTYAFILSEWFEHEKIDHNENNNIYKLFVRKTIKKTVMTHPYAAKYITAFKYFQLSVKEEFNIDIDYKSPEEIIFKRFYKFISTEVEDKFFLKNNSKKMVELLNNKFEGNTKRIIEEYDSKTNLTYFKFINKNFDYIIKLPENKRIRITKTNYILSNEIDFKKMQTSFRANWVQYSDALYARDIIMSFPEARITIHDCVITDILSVSIFIEIANEKSNRKIFESYKWNEDNNLGFYSIFIFI